MARTATVAWRGVWGSLALSTAETTWDRREARAIAPGVASGPLLAPLPVAADVSKDGVRYQARAGERRSRRIAQTPYALPEDLFPRQTEDGWRRARLSGRRAALLRKRAVREGAFGTYDAATGRGWLAEWDERLHPRTSTVMRPPKGRKHDNDLRKRLADIAKGLAAQAEKKAEFEKQRPPPTKKTGLAVVLRRNPWEK
jgi:hypothetical protein